MEFEELEGDPVLGGLVRHVRKLTDELAAAESSITVFASGSTRPARTPWNYSRSKPTRPPPRSV